MRTSEALPRVDSAASPNGLRAWPLAVVLGCASFLVLFDSLALATALPSIGADLGLGPSALQWVVSLYSLSIGALLILGGRTSDLWGRRRVLVASLAVTTAAGLLAGLAPSLPLLLAGRVLQGVAAAFALPAALSIAGTAYPTEPWRSRVFAVMAFAAWSAGLAGAILGGIITVHLGWRWVFLVTVPVGAAAFAAALALLPADPPRRDRSERLDVAGAVLASAGLVALLGGLSQLGEGAHAGRAGLLLCLAAALLGALVVVERRAAYPLVKPHLLRSRRIVGGCLAFAAYCAGYTAVIVVGSLHLQEEHGLSAARTGMVLSPVLLGGIVSSALSTRLLRRFSSRTVVAASIALCALTLAMMAALSGGSVAALVPWLVLWGVCSGPVYVRLFRECVTNVAESDRGTASGLLESMSHIGGGIAVAAYLTLLGAGVGYGVTKLVGALVVVAGAAVALFLLPRSDGQLSQPGR
ncbi:MFS transporter [Micromonospora sp. CPCC 206061]|uniref:MFS transporter n=1 Tax=Micromonospora sp. CPCC 206061 TaxID=3122410 RepID=UPI002FF2D8ED